MKSADEVGEYNVYVTIPGVLQKELGVICRNDSCESIEEFKKTWGYEDDDEELQENIDRAHQSNKGWIVMRLSLDPTEDPLSREKVRFLHLSMVDFLEKGGSVVNLENMTRKLERELQSVTADTLKRRSRMLESGEQPGA